MPFYDNLLTYMHQKHYAKLHRFMIILALDLSIFDIVS